MNWIASSRKDQTIPYGQLNHRRFAPYNTAITPGGNAHGNHSGLFELTTSYAFSIIWLLKNWSRAGITMVATASDAALEFGDQSKLS